MLAKPCIEPGCAAITTNGARCEQHRLAHQRQRDQQRGAPSQRGYDWTWQRRVKEAIRLQPWCSYCGTVGTPANPLTGDHVVPMSKGGSSGGAVLVACRRCNSARGNRA